jgi:hypothetical protein
LTGVAERAGGRKAARPDHRHRSPTMNATQTSAATCGFEMRFRSLFHEGRGFSFPCDAHGQVPLDALSERARNNYLYARTVIGREFYRPEVHRCDLH